MRDEITADTPPVTVVIVDDDPDIRMLLQAVLGHSSNGLDVVGEAHDGAEALELIEQLNPPPVPAVVVLDHQMPELSGLDVARQMLASRPGQPIILFTAFLTEELRREAMAVGITACLTKTDVQRLPELVRVVATSS